jgi:hypothetical protein
LHDALTDLPNRALFVKRVERALRRKRLPVAPGRVGPRAPLALRPPGHHAAIWVPRGVAGRTLPGRGARIRASRAPAPNPTKRNVIAVSGS